MEDNAIIELYFARSEQAIEHTLVKYKGLCLSVAQRILTDRRDTEECVMDVCMRLWNSIPPHRPSALGAYIARITQNTAIDKYSYNHADKRSSALTAAFEELEPFLPTANGDPALYSSANEVRSFINNFLKNLPEVKRIMFIRRYYYGESLQDIASACGCTESKVKNDLFRTKNRLRDELIKEGIYI